MRVRLSQSAWIYDCWVRLSQSVWIYDCRMWWLSRLTSNDDWSALVSSPLRIQTSPLFYSSGMKRWTRSKLKILILIFLISDNFQVSRLVLLVLILTISEWRRTTRAWPWPRRWWPSTTEPRRSCWEPNTTQTLLTSGRWDVSSASFSGGGSYSRWDYDH